MTGYQIILVFLLLGTFWVKIPYRYFIFSCVLLFLIAARDIPVGKDLPNYIGIWYSDYSDSDMIELGIVKWGAFLWNFSNEPWFYIAMTALVTVVPVLLFFKKVSPDSTFSLLIYFLLISEGYFFAYSGLRQAFGTACLLWFLYCFFQRRWIWAAGFLALAYCFHHSSVFIVPLLFFCSFSYSATLVIPLIIASASIGLLMVLLPQILTLLPLQLLPGVIRNYILFYSTYDVSRTLLGNLSFIVPFSLVACLLATMKKQSPYFKLFLWGTIIQNLFIVCAVIHRVVLVEILLMAVIFPMYLTGWDLKSIPDGAGGEEEERQLAISLRRKELKKRRLITVIVIAGFCGLFLYNLVKIMNGTVNDIVPYQFYWEERV